MANRHCAALIGLALLGSNAFATSAAPLAPAGDCSPAGRVHEAVEIPVAPPFPPVQLDVSVPVEPTVFPAGGLRYVLYELHLQSYTDAPLDLQALEIVDASRADGEAIASFTGTQLHERLRAVGADTIDGDHPLEGGKRAVAFICLAFDAAGSVPEKLAHRLLVAGAAAEGPVVNIRRDGLKVLVPPVSGPGWLADNGPGLSSHHRTGLIVARGRAHLARRFAIDWKQVDEQGEVYAGDARDVRAYHAYGKPVFAVADAVVVSATDGMPDNIPRTPAGFDTAVPITMENVAGNAVVLDLGDGQFAYYAHLKPGSVRVKAGDRVRHGEPLAEIGNSGDARWPHLHFQVTLGPHILASEGVPFLIDGFSAKGSDGTWTPRANEYPTGDIQVDFPGPG